jgi:3-hydroxyacyl-[acyl-carrier-protein] dehydratase
MDQPSTQDTVICDALTIKVPDSHPCFEGHFPGAPLVPGALLLKWIEQALHQQYGKPILRIKQIKFHAPITPGAKLSLECCRTNNSIKLSAYSTNRALLAAGHFTLQNQ